MSTHTSGLSSTSSNTMQPPGQSSNPSIPSGLPPYVHHLQSKWRESGTSPVTPERYRLRTWYIHHVHNPTWKIPRLVELHTDPLQWHHDILQQWRDQLHSDAVLNIAVVFPEVRALRQAQVHADVILIQGAHDRSGGLTTVFPQEVTKGAATHGQHHIPDISVVLRFFVEFLLTISYSLMRVMFSMEECRFLSLLSPRIGR